MRSLCLVVSLAACGRIGFDPAGDARPSPDADLAIVCGPAYQPVAGLTSRYRIAGRNTEWFPAELDCESDGGHLAVPDDPSEEAWLVTQTFGWIGITDHAAEGLFRPVSGGALVYEHWKPGEPNDATDGEDCVEIRADGEWNDTGCGVNREYVCECDGAELPAPPLWCDTNLPSSCGTCDVACVPGDRCVAQVCTPPGSS